ncbi:hypothetical protein JTE90_007932 [Oedothorax gibbosus]|uniref:DUF5641 domain-containing protein n=1 Tax=Oedothorax gibbosus TaxID=931172 RepID=A0AAV6VJI2_9ARAC|nr:hypothetical protein JTE90_007932 [Oedothorax gibbosus]
MFLHEVKTSGVPDIDEVDNSELNKRSKHLQEIREVLRSRFRSEYLGQLCQQSFKDKLKNPIAVGDIVLLEDPNKKRTFWSMARVLKLITERRCGGEEEERSRSISAQKTRSCEGWTPRDVTAELSGRLLRFNAQFLPFPPTEVKKGGNNGKGHLVNVVERELQGTVCGIQIGDYFVGKEARA